MTWVIILYSVQLCTIMKKKTKQKNIFSSRGLFLLLNFYSVAVKPWIKEAVLDWFCFFFFGFTRVIHVDDFLMTTHWAFIVEFFFKRALRNVLIYHIVRVSLLHSYGCLIHTCTFKKATGVGCFFLRVWISMN